MVLLLSKQEKGNGKTGSGFKLDAWFLCAICSLNCMTSTLNSIKPFFVSHFVDFSETS